MANGGFYMKSMRHYQQACSEYPGLSINDEKFQRKIRSLVQAFHSTGGGEGVSSSTYVLSFDIIKQATVCIAESNIQAATEILAYMQGIGRDAQILGMVHSYFKLCQTTLDSLHRLQGSLGGARNKLMELHGDLPVEIKVREAVRCAQGGVDDLFLSLPHLIREHVMMLAKLQQARDEGVAVRGVRTDNSTPRIVTTIILVSVFAGAIICSILAVTLQAHPVLIALPPAVISIVSWGPFIQWLDLDGLWAQGDEALARRSAQRVAMGKKRNMVIKELQVIKLLMDAGVSCGVDITVSNRERERAVQSLLNTVTELNEQLEKCCGEICKARRNFFLKVTEPKRPRDRARQFISRQADRWEQKKDTLLEKMSEKFDNFTLSRVKS